MAVRCGYCKEQHDSPEQVSACGETDMRLIRRNTKPEPYPALAKAYANTAALRELHEEPVDLDRNLEGVAAARAALTRRAASAA